MAAIPPEKAPKPGLNIYGCASVNPVKLTIAVEELGIPYNFITLGTTTGELGTEWFASISPQGKVPAIVHVKEDGTSVTVFESGACLLYIVSEFDKENKFSYPVGTPEYWSQLSWLSWQIAGYGPMMGQAAYFNRFATKPVPYAVERYLSECAKFNDVLNKQLASSPFVAGDRMTVADFAIFIFAHSAKWCGIDINKYSHVKAWHDKLAQRPAFQKALQVPEPYHYSDEAVSNPNSEAQEFYKNMRKRGGQGLKKAHDAWKVDVVPLPSDHTNHWSGESDTQ
ncbi:glutathione S-transferase [Nemania abortiva]|nr:glutathione S-transferase [Nemania abortiva]